jgi:uncharacterized protein with PQ loop repeat
MWMQSGPHHQHVRKRLYKNLESYPHTAFWVKVLDTVVYGAGILGPAFTIPQLYLIYGEGQVAGVSIVTWSFYALLNIPWIIYGIVHKEPVIRMTYTLWFLVNSAVVVGVLMYQ